MRMAKIKSAAMLSKSVTIVGEDVITNEKTNR